MAKSFIGLDSLELSPVEEEMLQKLLAREGISKPIVLRDHRKRGPVYWSLIFDSAKNASKIFGLPPLKMANFEGIYLVDSANYSKTLSDIAKKIGSADAITRFSEAKANADKRLNALTAELSGSNFEKMPNRKLAEPIKKFYEVRYPYTQYSFFFDTITKSVDLILCRFFRILGVPEAKRQLAYVPNADTIEFVYFEKKNDFLKKNSAELALFLESPEKCSESFCSSLDALMAEFADLGFVNFAAPLQTREEFVRKILSKGKLCENISCIQKMGKEKRALLKELLAEASEKGVKAGFLETLFDFAGNLSAWESEARHTWTRLHRVAKPLIEEIGKSAAKQGLIGSKDEIYKKQIKEIIEIAKALAKD